MIKEAIGDGWVGDLSQLTKLVPLGNDKAFRDRVRQAKRTAKANFAEWLQTSTGQIVDPDTIFDSQIKRIHEYKRQLLNALHVIVLYNRIRQNPEVRSAAADRVFRRQGGTRLRAGQADHQVHQQRGRDDRRRPGHARQAQASSSFPITTSALPSG